MSGRVVIVDTNVVVAGLTTRNADSPVARVLDGMMSAAFPFVVSEELVAEYRDVLLRPVPCKLHGLSAEEVEAVLTDVVHNAIVVQPPLSAAAPDPGDQHVWDLLAFRTAFVLVTRDKLLLGDARMKGRVISPREFASS